MMNWRKSPEALVATFQAALPDDGSAEPRQMFGYPAAFVNGRMATGLHQEDLILRLPEGRRNALLAQPGARIFEPMPGRPMKGYVVVPPAIVGNAAELRAWMREAIAHTASLPPNAKGKAKSPARAKAPAKAKAKAKAKTPRQAQIKTKTKPRPKVNAKANPATRKSRSSGHR
jgi:TfoX/Sxy family transcriptional regulator of competence genes